MAFAGAVPINPFQAADRRMRALSSVVGLTLTLFGKGELACLSLSHEGRGI